jgi:hypothetical protein
MVSPPTPLASPLLELALLLELLVADPTGLMVMMDS